MIAEDTPVIRIEHEGRVYRWERSGSAWPGHTAFVALRGREVVLGDRYAREGIERSYACSPEDLLAGCFAEALVEQLGQAVYAEVLAEVRHQLGVSPGSAAAASAPKAASTSKTASPAASASVGSTPKAASSAAASSSAASSSAASSSAAVEPVSADSAGSTADEPTARVQVVLSACPTVDMALVVALRAITRGRVADLLPGLQAPPHVVAVDVPRAEGEAIAQRLRSVGATVDLGPVPR